MTNYRRGYEIERKLMNNLRHAGYVAFRSAGSHSFFDVVGIRKDGIVLIQAKRTKLYRPKMFDKESKALKKLEVPACCRKELWIWEDGYGWRFINVS